MFLSLSLKYFNPARDGTAIHVRAYAISFLAALLVANVSGPQYVYPTFGTALATKFDWSALEKQSGKRRIALSVCRFRALYVLVDRTLGNCKVHVPIRFLFYILKSLSLFSIMCMTAHSEWQPHYRSLDPFYWHKHLGSTLRVILHSALSTLL